MSYASCPVSSLATSVQFTFKMCVAAGNCKKTFILGVQDHSRSSTLTPVKSLSLLLVMISSMYVPTCNRFDTTRDNCGIITTF